MFESWLAATKGSLHRLAAAWGLAAPDKADQPDNAVLLSLEEQPSTSATCGDGTAEGHSQDAVPTAASGNVLDLRGDAPPPVLASVPSSYGETRIAALS